LSTVLQPIPAGQLHAAQVEQDKLAYEKGLAIITTRIRDFKADKTRVILGETVNIVGYLEWHLFTCHWYGLDGQSVKLVLDGETLPQEYTCGGGGEFRILWVPDTMGTHTVKATFEGTLFYGNTQSWDIEITVISKQQKEEEDRNFMLLAAGVGGATVIGVAGLAYYLERRRRSEEMMLMMGKR